MYLVISLLGFEGRIWDLIVSVPDHCLSFYFSHDVAHFIQVRKVDFLIVRSKGFDLYL